MQKSYFDPDIRIYSTHESVAYASAATREVKLYEYRLPDEPEQPKNKTYKVNKKKPLSKKKTHSDTALLSAEIVLLLVLVLVLTVTILRLGDDRALLQEKDRELQSLESQTEALREIIDAGKAEQYLKTDEQLSFLRE